MAAAGADDHVAFMIHFGPTATPVAVKETQVCLFHFRFPVFLRGHNDFAAHTHRTLAAPSVHETASPAISIAHLSFAVDLLRPLSSLPSRRPCVFSYPFRGYGAMP